MAERCGLCCGTEGMANLDFSKGGRFVLMFWTFGRTLCEQNRKWCEAPQTRGERDDRRRPELEGRREVWCGRGRREREVWGKNEGKGESGGDRLRMWTETSKGFGFVNVEKDGVEVCRFNVW